MNVHLIDGTYELFRHFYALPSRVSAAGQEVAAVRGVLGSMLSLLHQGSTHVAVATDHVIESFRNNLWPGYKDSTGVPPELLAQFAPLEEALAAMGLAVWAMVEYEADDALAAGAEMAAADAAVTRVLICTPDKDLAQCVVGDRVVQFDRRQRRLVDEAGVISKFGVPPVSIPDYLALVGDEADGFPGLPGWGAKSTATVLGRYRHLEHVPERAADWDVAVRGAPRLAATLSQQMERALLFRRLATLERGAPVSESVAALKWAGPTARFRELCAELDAPELAEWAENLAGGFSESPL